MSSLKDRIAGAERAAVMDEDPLAAIFQNARRAVAAEPPSDASNPSVAAPAPRGPQLRELPVDLLDEMEQPFRLYTQDKLEKMRESISRHGIIQRIIVRPYPEGSGRYQIISGRNRRRAAELAGYVMVPCEIRPMDDTEARLQMVATNLEQREELLPSEKAWAYRIRLEALAHQGKRTSVQIEQKSSREEIAEQDGESPSKIQRYIRLTYLIPELLEAVDTNALGFTAGVSLSYLSADSQANVHHFFFVEHPQKIGGELADKLRSAGEKRELTDEVIRDILSPDVKPKPLRKVAIPMKPLRRYFPPEATPKEIEKQIIEIVTEYFATQTKREDDVND